MPQSCRRVRPPRTALLSWGHTWRLVEWLQRAAAASQATPSRVASDAEQAEQLWTVTEDQLAQAHLARLSPARDEVCRCIPIDTEFRPSPTGALPGAFMQRQVDKLAELTVRG